MRSLKEATADPDAPFNELPNVLEAFSEAPILETPVRQGRRKRFDAGVKRRPYRARAKDRLSGKKSA